MHKLTIRTTIASVLIWKLALIACGALAPIFLRYQPTFSFAGYLIDRSIPQYLSAWANFDGVHYLSIASRGYLAIGYVQAFFPVWPLLLSLAWWLSHDLATTMLFGQSLALGFFGLALVLLPHVTRRYARPHSLSDRWLLWLILLFPTAFYFSSVYTESLFLALVLATFAAASSKRWWLAGLLAALASATRVVGIVLVPALLIELALQTDLWGALQTKPPRASIGGAVTVWSKLTVWLKTHGLSLLAISLGSLGLAAYSTYLWFHFADPLYFFHVQSEFGAGRQETLILLPQVVWRYLKILTTTPLNLRYLISVQEFLAGLGSVIVLLLGWRRVRVSLWFFSLVVVLIPSLTGTFSSMARYVLVAPALFMILESWFDRRPAWRLIWLIGSGCLLVLNTMLFVQGYWVA